MKRKTIISLGLTFILTMLIVGNPNERKFLQAVADDFGSVHHGVEISESDLAKIGTSRYRSFLIFSRYEYAFGTIKVNYFGIGFMTFYQGSNARNNTKDAEINILQS